MTMRKMQRLTGNLGGANSICRGVLTSDREAKMGIVIQGPWKKRTVREIIEHELLILEGAAAQPEATPAEASRWPTARIIAGTSINPAVQPRPIR